MLTHSKLYHLQRRQFTGPRRSHPPVRALNWQLKETIQREKALLDAIVHDARFRAAAATGMGVQLDSLGVFLDFDHIPLGTLLSSTHLPAWITLSEYMKAHIGFQLGRCFGCYSFTVNVHKDLEARWTRDGRDHADRIQRRLRLELDRAGLTDLPYFYILEGRTRHGKSRTGLHLHGYFVTEDPIVAAQLKPIFERALRRDDRRQIVHKRTGIHIEPSYDVVDGLRGPGRWVSYVTKNAFRPDRRLARRRSFMSQPLTQLAREFWAMISEEPL